MLPDALSETGSLKKMDAVGLIGLLALLEYYVMLIILLFCISGAQVIYSE